VRAITLTQPWATLVATGQKRIETRSWRTHYRGPIAIHAAKALPASFRGLDDLFAAVGCVRSNGYFTGQELPRGAVVATARLVACIPTEDVAYEFETRPWWPLPEYRYGDYSEGRWAWILVNVQRLDPAVPAKGALGLWEWPTADKST
jgi:activating signal cointegrator 1